MVNYKLLREVSDRLELVLKEGKDNGSITCYEVVSIPDDGVINVTCMLNKPVKQIKVNYVLSSGSNFKTKNVKI